MADRMIEALNESYYQQVSGKAPPNLTPAIMQAAEITVAEPQLSSLPELQNTIADMRSRAAQVAGQFASYVAFTNPDKPDLPSKITNPTLYKDEYRKLRPGYIPLGIPDRYHRDRIGFYPRCELGNSATVRLVPVAEGGSRSRGMEPISAPIAFVGRTWDRPTDDTLDQPRLTRRIQQINTSLYCMDALLGMLLTEAQSDDMRQPPSNDQPPS